MLFQQSLNSANIVFHQPDYAFQPSFRDSPGCLWQTEALIGKLIY